MGLDEFDHNGMTTMVWLKGMGLTWNEFGYYDYNDLDDVVYFG